MTVSTRFSAVSSAVLPRIVPTLVVFLFTLHLLTLLSYSVNMPLYDEWEFFRPGALAPHLNWAWVFRPHNEHIIATTKLIAWELLYLGELNFVGMVAFSFGVYLLLCGSLVLLSKRLFNGWSWALLLPFASTLASENFASSFQVCFHLFLLFFVLAVYFGFGAKATHWLGIPFAVLGVYSLAAGVICAGVYAVAQFVTACFYKPWRRRGLIHATLVGLAIAAWLSVFVSPPQHPPLAMPWSWAFWDTWLNELGFGFGYERITWTAGIVALAWVGAGLVTLVRLSSGGDWQRLAMGFTYAAGILASLATIATSRAGFGIAASHWPRYSEIAMALMPFAAGAILAGTRLLRYPDRTRVIMAAVAWVLLLAPYHDEYRFKRTYRPGELQRLAGAQCVQDLYENHSGHGVCKMSYPGALDEMLPQALTLGVSFTHATTLPLASGAKSEPGTHL